MDVCRLGMTLGLALLGMMPLAARTPKALIIMLDGTRADALDTWAVPTIHQLQAGKWQPGYRCAWSLNARTIYDAAPNSAPNHVSIATGVTAAKHKVTENSQAAIAAADYTNYPTWLTRVVTADASRKALFVYKWNDDVAIGSGVTAYNGGSEATNLARVLEELNSSTCADAILYYIDAPDATGHSSGFYPLSETYLNTVKACDDYISDCLAAIAARATFKDEDWLIAVTSDHGGIDKNHGYWGGMCESIPVFITSPKIPHGRIDGMPYHFIATTTALAHFGIDTSSLDQAPATTANVHDPHTYSLTDGLDYYVNFDGTTQATITNQLSNGKTVAFDQGLGSSTLGATGRFGKCFTAQNRGLSLVGTKNHAFTNGTDFCCTMWVKIPSNITSDPCLFGDKDWNKGSNNGFALIANGKKGSASSDGVFFNLRQSGGRDDMGTLYRSLGQWVFYAVVRDGTSVVVYQGRPDGTLEWMGRYTSFVFGGYDFHVGQDGTGTYSVSLLGTLIDDVGFWSRALNVEEVRRIYLAGQHGRCLGDLIAYEHEPRTLAVNSVEDTTVNLAFSGNSSRTHALCLASGTTDGADNKQAWTDFTVIGTVAPGATSGTYTLPSEWTSRTTATSYRFFLLQTTDLPYAQELEFVKSDGSAYIQTDITAYTPYTRVEADLLAPSQNGSWMWMFGAYSSANTSTPKMGNFSVARRNTGSCFYHEVNGNNTSVCAFALNTRYQISFDPTTLTVNGTSYATGQTRSGFTTSTYPMTLFRTYKDGSSVYDQSYTGRFYDFKAYDGERLTHHLVPAKNASGTIGFADVESGKFFANANSSGSFTAGALDATTEEARRGIVRDQSITLTYQPPTTPVIAIWTGAGADPTVYTAADNWSCTNALGNHLEGAVPTSETEQIALDADADWRALAAGTSFNVPVDLRGHVLTLANAVTATLRNTTDASGEVRVEVAADTTLTNTGMVLLDNLKLTKLGAGTFLQQVKTNTYTGGTVVEAGTVTTPASGSSSNTWAPTQAKVFGASGSTITVRTGAVFNLAGNYDYTLYPFVLDGGTLRNSGADQTQTSWSGLGNITLTADSTLDSVNTLLMCVNAVVDLGGHTLDVRLANDKYWFIKQATYTNGTVKVTLDGSAATTGRFQLLGDVSGATVNWDLNCYLEVKNNLSAHDFTCRHTGTWGYNDAAKKVSVKGTFTPVSDYFCNVEMLDGSTLDLTTKTGVWSTTSLDTANSKTYRTTFAADASVTVNLAGRTLAVTDEIIAWADKPSTTTFAWDATTSATGVVPVFATVGLYYGADPESRVVDTAVWTNGAGNGDLADMANWECRNMAGNIVTSAVPGSVAAVTVQGENLNVQMPTNTTFNYAKFTLGDITLGADCDWRGYTANITSRIDLNGHSLTLSQLKGSGEITDNLIENGGFEKFTGSSASGSYRYFNTSTFAPAAWTSSAIDAMGVCTAGSAWEGAGNGGVPQGAYALFAQWGKGHADPVRTLSQTFTVKKPGAHTFVFYTAGRPNMWGLTVLAKIDGETVASHDTSHASWQQVSAALDLTAGEHTLVFEMSPTVTGQAKDIAILLDSVMISPVGSSFHVDVPESTTTIDTPVLHVTGAFPLQKEGKGTLQMQGGGHGYLGTEVKAGTVRIGTTLGNSMLGVLADQEVGVAPDAVFDLGGRNIFARYTIRLDGGTLKNEYGSGGPSDYEVYVNRLQLTADSVFQFSTMKNISHDVFIDSSGVWDFGGHTLTMNLTGTDPDVTAYSGATFRNGTLKLYDGGAGAGFFQNRGLNGADNFTFDYNASLRLRESSTVSNFICRTGCSTVASESGKLLTILGTYTPISPYGVNTRMANGSAIDLSSKTGVWSTSITNLATCATPVCTVSFADNATVTIDVHGRALKSGDKIVGWATPSNLATLTFVPDANTLARGFGYTKADDGLYIFSRGLLIILR